MDGTLIDSEPYWIGAETDLAAQWGIEWTHDDGLQLVGNPLPVSAQVLRGRGVDLPGDEIVAYLLGRVRDSVKEHVPWQDDARSLLEELHGADIPLALVTMSYTPLAEALTSALPGVFDVVVTGDTVSRGKPDPEAFLTAAKKLGVDIETCVAFEDSPAGVQSAWSSGARTVGVKRLTPIPSLPGLSRVASLEDWGLDVVQRVANGEVIDELSAHD